MSVDDPLLVIGESGDWLSVIPIDVPVEAALKHIGEVWGTSCHQLEKIEGKESSPETDASVLEAVMREVRKGPIAGNRGTEEPMWALRRQGDMLFLVSDLMSRRWRLIVVVSTAHESCVKCLEVFPCEAVRVVVKFGVRVAMYLAVSWPPCVGSPDGLAASAGPVSPE